MPPEQGGKREDTPNHCIGCNVIADEWFWRPIVCIRVIGARPERESYPSGPSEECRELIRVMAVADSQPAEAMLGGGLTEERTVVIRKLGVRCSLGRREGKSVGRRIVAIGLELLGGLA